MTGVEYHKLQALIVDDFDSFRVTVSKMLQDIGVQFIDSAVNGADALRHCKMKSYDLILCDHNLGKGKTGQQVLEDLRHYNYLKAGSLFILISAESSKSIIMAAYDYEPDAYLTKPITTKALQQRLSRLFEQRAKMAPIYQAMDDQQLDVALALCHKEINSDGRYANVCQKLAGQLYLQQGKYSNAETVYRDVLEVRQLDWAQLGMARTKQLQGDLLGAQQWLEDVMTTNPMCMKAYDLFADIYREQQLNERLQDILQKAVEISPLSILRQQQLGDAASVNHDNAAAANAYRRTVRLGENSCFDQITNHTGFARATVELFKEDKELAKPLLRDALKTMSELDQRFSKTVDEKIETLLLESQLFVCNGDQKKADECVSKARAIMTNGLVEEPSLLLSIELVRALRVTGQKDAAEKMIQELLEKYRNDESALQKIDSLLEEPASQKNRALVAAVNKKGIAFYDAQQYDAAIECFKNALQTFPNHVGIRLNLVQALLDKLKLGFDQTLMDLSTQTLAQVDAIINPSHDQNLRYQQLQTMRRDVERSRPT